MDKEFSQKCRLELVKNMEIHELIKQFNQNNLLTVILGIIVVLLLVTLDILLKLSKIKRRAKRKIKKEAPIVDELQDQYAIISNQAGKYSNSLGSEGAKLLYELRSILDEQKETLQMLDNFLENNQIEEIEHYYFNFDELTPKQKMRWISRSKDIIQLLGKKIYEVSERSSHLGMPKVSRRESTINTLKKANIIKEDP